MESNPKPYDGLPPILNAGSSPQGRDFAARNSDVVFTVVGGPEDGAEVVEMVTAAARDTYGRRVGVFTPSYSVCRQTRAEAHEFHRWYAEEHADWDAVDNLMTLQGLHARSFTPEMLEMFRGRFAAGHGVCPLIGTPDDVAAEIQRFAQCRGRLPDQPSPNAGWDGERPTTYRGCSTRTAKSWKRPRPLNGQRCRTGDQGRHVALAGGHGLLRVSRGARACADRDGDHVAAGRCRHGR